MKYRYSLLSLTLLAAFVCAFVTQLPAQTTTTGEVSGVVSDPNGAAVPNVTVTLSGPNLIRPMTAVSGSDGAFRLGSVPPGRYTVDAASASGFAPFKVENVEVNLGRTTTANITMTPAGATGVVDVIGGTPEIDQSSNTTGSNISTEFFSNIPTSRTVQGLYTIAPTVTRSGLRDASGRERDPSVAGSSGPENSYILDGINTTDPAFGGGGANLPFEFVQEVEIKTGAFGADQGLVGLTGLGGEAGDGAANVGAVEGRRRADLAGEEPLAERAEGDQADPELLQGRDDLGLGLPPPQRVLGLQGGDRLDGVGASDRLWAGL